MSTVQKWMKRTPGFMITIVTLVFLAAACTQQVQPQPEPEPEPEPGPVDPTPTAPEAVYRDADGNLISITEEQIASNDFVFYVWLEDAPEVGIDPSLIGNTPGDPGAPVAEELDEVAPSQVQNLAAAYLGVVVDGEVFPVIGADLRWDLRDNPIDSVGFGAADNGLSHPGYDDDISLEDVSYQQADTTTNSASLENERFPVARAGETFPLFNRTGVGSPNIDGFSWVTLYSVNLEDEATLVALAEINGAEVASKRITNKIFAPVPDLEIVKTVEPDNVVVSEAGVLQTTPTFTVTVTNNGNGDATNVMLQDRLTDGPAEPYSIVPPAGTTPVDQDADEQPEGFNATFDVAAGESVTFTFDADTSVDDTYCDTATVIEYSFAVGEAVVTEQSGISAEACFTVSQPELSIIKDFIDGTDTETVAQGEDATLRVRLINNGTAAATGVELTDMLNQDEPAGPYSITAPEGTNPIDQDEDGDAEGFSVNVGDIGVGETVEYTFPARASADGEYCDTASFTSTNSQPGEDSACLTVATPELQIAKTNTPDTVLPGGSYESTITVTNVGSATATGVLITDRIGFNDADGVFVEYESSNLDGNSGIFDSTTNTVTAPSDVDIAPEETVTFTVTSSVPSGAAPGEYCDVAAFTSENAGEGEIQDCITVPAFAALQTQFVDEQDPLAGGSTVTFTSTLYNEQRSNERVIENDVAYVYDAGDFDITATRVYFDSDPVVDEATGLVLSGPANADAQLDAGVDYTVSDTGTGQQTIVFVDMALAPDEAFYIVHEVTTSQVADTTSYSSTYVWTPVGASSGTQYDARSAESTTVTTD